MEAGNLADIIFQQYRELVAEEEAKTWFGITPAVVDAADAVREKELAGRVTPMGLAGRRQVTG